MDHSIRCTEGTPCLKLNNKQRAQTGHTINNQQKGTRK